MRSKDGVSTERTNGYSKIHENKLRLFSFVSLSYNFVVFVYFIFNSSSNYKLNEKFVEFFVVVFYFILNFHFIFKTIKANISIFLSSSMPVNLSPVYF